jgi:hypothetical protein
MYKPLILTALAALAMLGMQACFYTGSSGPYASSLPSVTTHTVCDTNGNNCLACDDNNNCERADSQYGSSSRHSVCDADGNNCLNCDSNNNNCQSTTARSHWGFFF